MKVLLTSLLALLFQVMYCCTSLTAQQRYIDWEVTAVSPVDTVVSGNALPLRFKWTNHGPDAWQHGDSLLYMLIKSRNGNEQIVYGGALYNYYEDLQVGQTAVYGDNYSIMFDHPEIMEPTVIDFCVYIFTRGLLASGDSLILSYDDPDLSNNYSCQQVTVLPQGTGIGDEPLAGTKALLIYPNPATSTLYLEMRETADAEIHLTDLVGKQWLSKHYQRADFDERRRLSLAVDHLPEGVYIISVIMNDQIRTEKLWITRR